MNASKKNLLDILEDYKRNFGFTFHDMESLASEVSDMLYLVSDIMRVEARETEGKEPYATRYIDSLYNAARYVADMASDIESVLVEEDE